MIYPPGSTGQSVNLLVLDNSGFGVTGLTAATFPDLFYSLAGASPSVAVTPLTDLAAEDAAWSSGGVFHRGGGVYRVDLPDDALAAAGEVVVRGSEQPGKRVVAKFMSVEYAPADVLRVGGFPAPTSFGAGVLQVDVVGIESGTQPLAAVAAAVWDRLTSALTVAGSIGAYVLSKLGVLGTGTVVTVSPVSQSGDVSLTRGASYYAADGRAIEWAGASADVWPDLTGAAVAFNVADGTLVAAGTVVTPTGTQRVRVELSEAQTGVLATGSTNRVALDFDVWATLASGHAVPLLRGKCVVTDSEAG